MSITIQKAPGPMRKKTHQIHHQPPAQRRSRGVKLIVHFRQNQLVTNAVAMQKNAKSPQKFTCMNP